MGIHQERVAALMSALRHIPATVTQLGHRWLQGHPELDQWLAAKTAEGRDVLVIVMIERLGDIVSCTPIPRQLKQQNPSLAVAWICSGKYADALAHNPWIDRVFHEESLACWLLTKRKLRQPIRCHELFLDSQRCTWTGIKLPGRHSGIDRRNYLSEGRNLLLAYSRAASIPNIADDEPDLFSTSTVSLPSSIEGKPLIAVHLDSEDPDRRLNQEAAHVCGHELIKNGWGVIELGLRPLASNDNPHIFFPGEALPLRDHISLLRMSSRFIGVDSGFMHCANALRKPATVFIGKFRDFSHPQTFSGSWWHSSWHCVYGPWNTVEIPTQVVLSHLSNIRPK